VFVHSEFRDVLVAASGRKGGMGIDQSGLGYWLRSNKGRIANGMRIASKKPKGHASQWWIEEMKG
jgi:hypothetical protein